jgi:hypothetical protein
MRKGFGTDDAKPKRPIRQEASGRVPVLVVDNRRRVKGHRAILPRECLPNSLFLSLEFGNVGVQARNEQCCDQAVIIRVCRMLSDDVGQMLLSPCLSCTVSFAQES